MSEVNHETFRYTNQPQKPAKILGYTILILFGLGAISALILGVYFLFPGNDFWIVSCFLIPVSVILGWIAWVAYDHNVRKRNIIYEFALHEKGIDETWYSREKDKIKENQIMFDDMDQVLIGNYVDRMPGAQGMRDYFKFGVLVIIMYENTYFFQRIFKANELTEWLLRMTDKNVPVYYTPYDLKQAYLDQIQFDVEFSKIKGVPWEEIEEVPPVEHEMIMNPFTEWQDEDLKDTKKNATQKKSGKVDRLVTGVIFLYALFTGSLIMPRIPLEDGTFAPTSDLFLLTVVLVNLLIPVIFVFWRKFTKWYMPVIYFLSALAGNCLALLFVHIFSAGPPLYDSALFANLILLVFLWYPALIVMKLAKLVFSFMYRHNF